MILEFPLTENSSPRLISYSNKMDLRDGYFKQVWTAQRQVMIALNSLVVVATTEADSAIDVGIFNLLDDDCNGALTAVEVDMSASDSKLADTTIAEISHRLKFRILERLRDSTPCLILSVASGSLASSQVTHSPITKLSSGCTIMYNGKPKAAVEAALWYKHGLVRTMFQWIPQILATMVASATPYLVWLPLLNQPSYANRSEKACSLDILILRTRQWEGTNPGQRCAAGIWLEKRDPVRGSQTVCWKALWAANSPDHRQCSVRLN